MLAYNSNAKNIWLQGFNIARRVYKIKEVDSIYFLA